MSTRSAKLVIQARDEASKKFGKIGKSAQGMGKMIKTAMIAGAGIFAVGKLISFAKESAAGYAVQEQAEAKLEQAIKATGGAAGFSADELKKHASELQNVTTIGDESTIAMMSVLATFKNVKGDEFLEATGLIQDMSVALGSDLQGASIQVGKALNDPLTGVSALSKVGVSFTDVQKEQIKGFMEVNDVASAQKVIMAELASEFGGQAKAAAQTLSGQLTQLSNWFGDVKEVVGGHIMTMVLGIVNGLKTAGAIIKTFGGNFQGTGDKIGAIVGFIKKGIKSLATLWIYEFTAVEVFIQNWRESFSIAWKSVKLGAITLTLDLKHLFGSTIPELLRWFRDNWRDIFVSLWEGTKSVIINIGKNFKNLFIAIKGFISGQGFDFKWTGLLDGFKSTVKEMPNILTRELSDGEKKLRGEIGDLGGKLGDKFQEKLQPRLALLNGEKGKTVGSAAGGLGSGSGGVNSVVDKVAGAARSSKGLPSESRFLTMSPGAVVDKTETNTGKTVTKLDRLISVTERGLEAVKQAATGGPGNITVSNFS
jgi:hypothetical protein